MHHVFAYLKSNHNARLVFDPTYPHLDEETFKKKNYSTLYIDIEEERPNNTPELRQRGY